MAVENRQLTGRLAIPDRELFFEAPVAAQDRDVKTILGRVAPQLVERCNDVSMNADGQSLGVGGRAEVGRRLASEVSRLHSSHSVSPMTSNVRRARLTKSTVALALSRSPLRNIRYKRDYPEQPLP